MPHLSRDQELARRQIAAAAAAGLVPEELGDRVLAAIDLAVPNDDCRLWTVDSSSLLLNRLVAASAGDSPFRLRWLRGIYLNPDTPVGYFTPHELMRYGSTAVTYQDRQEHSLGLPSPLRDPIPSALHRRAFHDTLTPIGGSTRLCLRAGGRWVGMLDVVSRDRRRPMTPTAFTFLRLVGPTIARALHAALAREQALAARATAPRTEATGILLLAHDRRISFVTPAGEYWLGRLPDGQRDGHAPLPTAVWAAAAALQAGGLDGPQPAVAVVVPSAAGSIRVEASRADEDGTIAIVFSPVRPPGPPELPETWALTSQERRVVQLLVGGASNRQLAAMLVISENTVETHLAHIYEKLGVRRRMELIGLLFRETHVSAFAAGDDRGSIRGQ